MSRIRVVPSHDSLERSYMYVEPPSDDDVIQHVDAFMDRVFERLEAGMAPVWEAQTEMTKTFVTLSSGALVITITLAQFIADQLTTPHWTWLLPASWILFGLSVVSGVLRHGWTSRARSTRAIFELRRGSLREAIRSLPRDEAWSQNLENTLATALDDANRGPSEAIKVHDALVTVSAWTFMIGLVSLLVFAIRNLPF